MSTDYSEFETELLEEIRVRLHDELASADEAGIRVDSLGDPKSLAGAVVAAIPTHVLDRKTGPFYDTSGLTAWLGLTRQALLQREQAHTLLVCVTGDGQKVYPAWQFTAEGVVLPGLRDVLPVLLSATDAWTAALWLRAPASDLDGQDAVTWLSEGGDPTRVVDAARADAARWAA